MSAVGIIMPDDMVPMPENIATKNTPYPPITSRTSTTGYINVANAARPPCTLWPSATIRIALTTHQIRGMKPQG